MSNVQTKKSVHISAALVSVVFLLFSIVMVWGNSSDWGKVKMQRLNFTYANDTSEYTGSALLFSPKSATTNNQAPGIVVLGGASSYSYALKAYGIEMARRGYVAILCDMPGQGQSSFVGNTGGYGNYKPTAGTPGGGEDATEYIKAVTAQLQSLNFVDQSKLMIGGFSAGQSWAVQAATNFCAGTYSTVITLSGYTDVNQAAVTAAGLNFIGVNANAGGKIETLDVVPGQVVGVGDFSQGGAYYCYQHPSAVQHQMQPTTPGLIAGACDAMELAYPTNTSVKSGSTIFMTAEIFSGVAIISLFVLIACLLKSLLSMSFFNSVHREEPVSYPAMGSGDPDPKRRKIKAIAFLSFRVLITIVLYELLAARFQPIPLFAGTAWAGLWINIWVPFLAANMVVNAVIFLIWHQRYGKPNGGNAYNYGLDWEKGTLVNIGKCLVLGLSITFVVLSLLNFLDLLLTINLKVMIFGMISFNMEHMLQMPFYILFYFALLFTASLTQYITNPAYEDGTAKGRVVATVRTTFIAILPYLVMVVWNTFKGIGAIKMAGQYGIDQFAPLDNMYGYPIMMSLVTPIMDMLRRKTKSVWPGVVVCAMLLGVLIACNYSLNASWFG